MDFTKFMNPDTEDSKGGSPETPAETKDYSTELKLETVERYLKGGIGIKN